MQQHRGTPQWRITGAPQPPMRMQHPRAHARRTPAKTRQTAWLQAPGPAVRALRCRHAPPWMRCPRTLAAESRQTANHSPASSAPGWPADQRNRPSCALAAGPGALGRRRPTAPGRWERGRACGPPGWLQHRQERSRRCQHGASAARLGPRYRDSSQTRASANGTRRRGDNDARRSLLRAVPPASGRPAPLPEHPAGAPDAASGDSLSSPRRAAIIDEGSLASIATGLAYCEATPEEELSWASVPSGDAGSVRGARDASRGASAWLAPSVCAVSGFAQRPGARRRCLLLETRAARCCSTRDARAQAAGLTGRRS